MNSIARALIQPLLIAGLLLATLVSGAWAAPTVSLTSPTAGKTFAAPATIALAATATPSAGTTIKNVKFYRGNTLLSTDTTAPYSFTWSNVAAGSYSLTAVATDSANKKTTSTAVAITVTSTNQAPTVTLTSPSAGAVQLAPGTFTLSASASDADGTIAKVEFFNGAALLGTVTTAPYNFVWSNVPAGSYSLTAKATDNLGKSTTSTAVAVSVNTLPAVTLTSPANNTVVAAPATVALAATASDSGGSIAKVEFFNGATLIGTATTAPYTATWANVPAGSYSLTAKATDNLGGQTTSGPATLVVDAPPVISLTSPANNAVIAAPGNVMLSANASDTDGTIAKVEFFNGATLLGTATTAPYNFAWNNVPAGSYSLTAKATDNLGITTTSAAVAITLDAPPTITLTAPSAGAVQLAPASFTLTANAADSDGTIAKVEFFNGATLIGTTTTPPYTTTWANVTAGSYSLTAKATDNLGTTTTSAAVNVTVVANSAPAVSLTSPTQNQSFTAPAIVTLAADASDPDGNLAKVEFFNGATLIATVLAAPYTADWTNVPQGSYTITAVATDALGAQTTSAAVSITVAPKQVALFFVHPDHLGTPRLITDQNNTVVWRNLPISEAFGNSPPEENPSGLGTFKFNLRHSGYYFDNETQTFYAYLRDSYIPAIGAFGQSDPIGLAGGSWSTYAFVNGNPLSSIDPEGLSGFGGAGNSAPRIYKPNEGPGKGHIEISTRGVCDGQGPECARAMTAAGMQGPFYKETKSYDLVCLMGFGLAGKVGGTAVSNSLAGQVPKAVAASGGSFSAIRNSIRGAQIWTNPLTTLGFVGLAIPEVLEKCEIKPACSVEK